MPNRPLFVATWRFGKAVADKALEVARSGHTMLDSIEQGIWVSEADEGNTTVGFGGTPNAIGQVELDACIMSGPGHLAGSVAAIQNYLHPISVARKVMENTPHVMLVGDGARRFAAETGYEPTEMLTPARKAAWEAWKEKQQKSQAPHQDGSDDIDDGSSDGGQRTTGAAAKSQAATGGDGTRDPHHHDTIALIGIDDNGDLYGGCSTSGWGYKVPGRVGDSPIIGSGLYVDNELGAVGSTGTGENVMRWCAAFWITQLMGQGLSPTEACIKVIREIARKDPLPFDKLALNFIALNKAGEFGAAGTSRGFVYATADPAGQSLQDAAIVTPE